VRLKLYLSALWIGVKSPHDIEFPARAWAELLGLDEPSGNGTRRVTDAVRWLEQERMLLVKRDRGRPSKLIVLDDAGSGKPYEFPWESKPQDVYAKLPAGFWTKQWITKLSSAGVGLLLILLVRETYSGLGATSWVSPGRARDLYSLSSDTWSRATKELRQLGLVDVSRIPVSLDDFSWRRVRNTYRLNHEALDDLRAPA